MIEIQGIERVDLTRRVDQIRRRIAEIEEKIGMIGVGDFQRTLEREIAKQANAINPTQAVADVQKPQASTKPVNENAAANAAKVERALREAAGNNQAAENNSSANVGIQSEKNLPGAAALPNRNNPTIERVEVPNVELDVPSRDDVAVFENNYVGSDAEVIPVEDLIMQAADEYGVDPQTVRGIVEYINQHQTPAQVEELDTDAATVEDLITQAAYEYGIDPQLVKAIAIAESDMNQDEISSVGAIGVMQLMPETAAGLGVNPYDTNENIAGGAKYLRQMLDTFDGDIPLAVAAYNAGPGAVKRYGGIPPYSETKNYVGRVMDMYR